jgi:hypothetical protein
MRSVWWSLPGPASALARGVHDLRDGRSLVVAVPASGSPSPAEQLVRGWYRDQWRKCTQDQFRAEPVSEVLIRQFCPDVPPHQRSDVSTLLKSERAAGLYLAIQIDDPVVWARWSDFLTELERLGKDLGPFKRPTFLVELTGPSILRGISSGMTVAWHEWRGVVGREDMRAYAAVVAAESTEPRHVREVRSAVASELALWDPELLEELMAATVDQLMNPLDFLLTYARGRDWQDDDLDQGDRDAWISGRLCEIGGTTRWHSAALAMAGHVREVHMRVWRGQVAALFPLIEELRLTAALYLDRVLPKPRDIDGKRVDDLRHLEIGRLCYLATRTRFRSILPPDVLEAITALRNMRNQLAHLDIVQPDALTSPALRGMLRRHAEGPELGS